MIVCAAEYDAVNHKLRKRRLPADTDLGFTVFIRIVGFPCALGMKFTLGLHLDIGQQCDCRTQFQYAIFKGPG